MENFNKKILKLKINKKIINFLNFKFRKLILHQGNIAIIVLIIGIVVILAVSTLSSFMIRDVRFTQLDQQKLQALNIAEAGISNMFLNIERYMNNEINSLPASGYNGKVISNGTEVGNYYVDYTITDEGYLKSYSIISKGIEKHGQQRTVKVDIKVGEMYNFIFSFNSINNGTGIINSLSGFYGPFMTNGNLDMGGNTYLFEGKPLIINGDLVAGGSSQIGEPNNPINLYLGGTCYESVIGGRIINLTDNFMSDQYNIYINKFYKQKFDIQNINIDDDYINSTILNGAIELDGNLTINNDNQTFLINNNLYPFPINNIQNYIKFSDDKTTLEILGNIVVNGDITFSGNKTIYYSGKGNLISTGSIYVNSALIPKDISNTFPSQNLLILMAKNNITFNLGNSSGGTLQQPDAALIGICNNTVNIPNNKYIRGNIMCNNLTINNNSTIYFEPNLSSYMPNNKPPMNFILAKNWQEIPNS